MHLQELIEKVLTSMRKNDVQWEAPERSALVCHVKQAVQNNNARAAFVSGPKILKQVRIPRALRTGATCFMEG
jgi:hypothetical protein